MYNAWLRQHPFFKMWRFGETGVFLKPHRWFISAGYTHILQDWLNHGRPHGAAAPGIRSLVVLSTSHSPSVSWTFQWVMGPFSVSTWTVCP